MFLGFPCGSASKESAGNVGDLGLIPGLGRSPGGGEGYPLQYSGLENSMDCIGNGVAMSRTQLSDLHIHFQETQTGALNQPSGVGCDRRWGRGSKGRGYMYIYGWFMLRFDGQQHNSESNYPSIKKD